MYNEWLRSHHMLFLHIPITVSRVMFMFIFRDSDAALSTEKSQAFHSVVMKLQYLAKRVRPDILLPVVYLSSRVTKSTESNWKKLERVVRYLKGTRELFLRLKPSEGLSRSAHLSTRLSLSIMTSSLTPALW